MKCTLYIRFGGIQQTMWDTKQLLPTAGHKAGIPNSANKLPGRLPLCGKPICPKDVCLFLSWDTKQVILHQLNSIKITKSKGFLGITLSSESVAQKYWSDDILILPFTIINKSSGGSMAKWFRALVLLSGGAGFKASTLRLAGIVSQ